MSKVDITLALLILVGAYGGFKEGFLMELISLLAIILGVLGGFKLMGWAMIELERQFHVDAKALPYIAFGAVFFIIVFLVNLLGKVIRLKINKSLLGWVDQAAGALLGLFKTAFMISVLLWIFHSLKFSFPETWTENSWIFPMVSELAPNVTHGIATILPFFEGVF